jgi:hypothetical protein
VRLFGHETFKLTVSGKAWLILLALLLLQGWAYTHTEFSLDTDGAYYRSYMQKLAGPVTAEKMAWIGREEKRFQKLNDALQKTLAQKGSAAQLAAIDLKSESKKKGATLSFVYDTGYDLLFGVTPSDTDAQDSLKLLLVLIGCFAGVYAMERRDGMDNLLAASYRGKGTTAATKNLLCMIFTIPAFLLAYLPGLFSTLKFYGIQGINASVSSLPVFSGFPAGMSILQVILLLYLVRLLGTLAAVGVILLLSQFSGNTIVTILSSLMLLAGPFLLHLTGVGFLDRASIYAVLDGNIVLQSTGTVCKMFLLPVILIGAAGYTLAALLFCKVGIQIPNISRKVKATLK